MLKARWLTRIVFSTVSIILSVVQTMGISNAAWVNEKQPPLEHVPVQIDNAKYDFTEMAFSDNETREERPKPSPRFNIPTLHVQSRFDKLIPSPSQTELTSQQKKLIEDIEKQKGKKVDKHSIKFASGQRVKAASAVSMPYDALSALKTPGKKYYLVQFNPDLITTVTANENALKQTGLKIVGRKPYSVFIVAADQVNEKQLLTLLKDKTINHFEPVPLEARLNNKYLNVADKSPQKLFKMAIMLYEDCGEAEVNILKKYCRVIAPLSQVSNLIHVEAKGNTVREINNLEFVRWVDEEPTGAFCTYDGTMAVAADIVQYNGLTGAGVNVAIADTGVSTHGQLPSSKIIDQYNYADEDALPDPIGHGTFVAGIIAASANNTVPFVGVAPGSSLLAYRFANRPPTINPISDPTPVFERFEELVSRSAQHQANVLNCSFRTLTEDTYYNVSRIVDKAVKGEYSGQPMVVVASAGNDGIQNKGITSPGVAKNAITVGATKDGNSNPFSIPFPPSNCTLTNWPPTDIACFSNAGPVDLDNNTLTRLKPDICAPGVKTTSIAPNDSTSYWKQTGQVSAWADYGTFSGTSNACAFTSGAVALLLGQNPNLKNWPEMVKAQVINTAIYSGSSPDLKDDKQGYGMIDVYHAIVGDSSFYTPVWTSHYVSEGIPIQDFSFDVPAGFKEVKATLTWVDPEGSEIDETLSDLDLALLYPNGSEADASSSFDDTVEHVSCTNGPAGTWIARVKKYSLTTSYQFFGLSVAIRMADPSPVLAASADKTSVQPGDNVKFNVNLSNNGYTGSGS